MIQILFNNFFNLSRNIFNLIYLKILIRQILKRLKFMTFIHPNIPVAPTGLVAADPAIDPAVDKLGKETLGKFAVKSDPTFNAESML